MSKEFFLTLDRHGRTWEFDFCRSGGLPWSTNRYCKNFEEIPQGWYYYKDSGGYFVAMRLFTIRIWVNMPPRSRGPIRRKGYKFVY